TLGNAAATLPIKARAGTPGMLATGIAKSMFSPVTNIHDDFWAQKDAQAREGLQKGLLMDTLRRYGLPSLGYLFPELRAPAFQTPQTPAPRPPFFPPM